MTKHNTVMSILDYKHGADRAVAIVDPAAIKGDDDGVVGKWIQTHVGQQDWATLWEWTAEGEERKHFAGYQTVHGRYCSDRELLEGMTFGRHGKFKPGEWLTDLRADGYIVIEVV